MVNVSSSTISLIVGAYFGKLRVRQQLCSAKISGAT